MMGGQSQIENAAPPAHVAVIMDGNGRWAAERGMPRVMGHRRGVEAVRRAVEAASDLGVKYLTLYSFSTENWKRPQSEVRDLMGLLRQFVETDLKRLKDKGVRVRIIGDRSSLSKDLVEIVERSEAETRSNDALNLTIAFNYGGRDEIIRAAQALAARAASGCLDPQNITQSVFSAALDTHDLPDPDLVIRTSGEKRISNFLIWQAAYAEFVFLDIYWPDFERKHLAASLSEYADRDRRYGGAPATAAG
ncbi:MAG: isoprenyl transferase [Pseudomonadota bacterium]